MAKEVKTTTTIEGYGRNVDIVVKADDFNINKKYLIWNFLSGGRSMFLGSQYLKYSGVLSFKGKLLSYFNKLLHANAPIPNTITPEVKKIEPTEIEIETIFDTSIYGMFGSEFFSDYSYLGLNDGDLRKITDDLLKNTYLKAGSVNKIKLY